MWQRVTPNRFINCHHVVMPTSELSRPRWAWYPVIFLLLLCLTRGLWVTRGLQSPAIMDTFRDAGFVQGIVDGNWFGDPEIAGAWRYYPPLVHTLFAAVCAVTGGAPLHVLMSAAPWINLIVPVGFFLMSRRLIGAEAAVFGLGLLVLFNGAVLPPWVTAAYHPWSSVPVLALGGFFFSVWLIQARIHTGRASDALLIGSAIGLVFLAHTVPAVILAFTVPVIAINVRGFSLKTLAWLALAGVVACVWSLPLLLPLWTSYRLHIVNTIPGSFIDPRFVSWPPSRGLLLMVLPGVLATPIIFCLRNELTLPRGTIAILAVWILLPILFLTRHYACDVRSNAAVCTVFVLPVHHWYIYLQAALTCVAGLGAWLCFKHLQGVVVWRRVPGPAGYALAAICCGAVLWLRPADDSLRQRALFLDKFFDWDTYTWLRQHSAPSDMFVTETLHESLNAASVAVMAAGRSSVALPATYSNPYVDWESRNRRSLQYLSVVRDVSGAATPAICTLLGEVGFGGHAYVILPNARPISEVGLHAASVGSINTIYRVVPDDCAFRGLMSSSVATRHD